MPSRTLPGLGLTGFWDLGADGWKDGMDANLRLLSALCQCAAISRSTALPGSPSNGAVYIVPSDAGANANNLAIRDNDEWVYVVPKEGFLVHVNDTDEHVKWTGSSWQTLSTGGGGATEITVVNKTASHSLTTADAGTYVRMNAASPNNLTVPTNASQAIPVGSVIQLRQVGAGQTTIVAASGVTVNTAETLKLRKQGSTASLIKVGTDEWDLTGDLEVAS